MNDRLDISFRFRPVSNSLDGVLLSYLKNDSSPISREMILKALRAFWLPEAHQRTGAKKGQALTRLAEDMIFALEEQADHLRREFSIERPIVRVVQQQQQQLQITEPQLLEEDLAGEAWNLKELNTGGL
jgi:hypothetical protein